MKRLLPLATCLALVATACKDASNKAPSKTAEISAVATEVAPTGTPSKDGFQVTSLEPSQGQLQKLLGQHTQKAQALGLAPYVELWAEWCNPCKAIEESLTEPLMKEAFAGTYIIRLNMDTWGTQIGDAGFGATAIPIFFEVDAAGKPTGRKIDGGAWGQDVPANMAPPLKAFFNKS